MKIEPDKVVSVRYRLSQEGGELENNRDSIPMAYLHGHANLLPSLEDAFTVEIIDVREASEEEIRHGHAHGPGGHHH